MSDIELLPLGAGQDVGRSCIVVRVNDKYLMLDCGMHLGHRDARRFPDFSLLSFNGRMTEMISAVIITHFHLDHCAALPYFTEFWGYQGPIYMTHPTKAIMPIMLEDYQKIMTGRPGDKQWYSRADIVKCMQKAVGIDLNQAVQIAPGINLKALYAGHVLGAAMMHLQVDATSILYTGDYNTTPDRHLGAAHLERLRPDLLVSEATYATTLRDSKKSRERGFMGEVIQCIQRGGKVLIPVFAVGRAQELMILVEEAWQRLGLVGKVPIFFSGHMAARANGLYRSMVNWASEAVRSTGARHQAFAFDHISAWEPGMANYPGPCVLFATPGMLNGGVSLEVFKQWAPDPNNHVVLPGYQAAGTIGGKLQSGQAQKLMIGQATVHVRCKVSYLSFSAHADAKGILQLVSAYAPKSVMLVHGDKAGMDFMAGRIHRMFGIPCTFPPNGNWVTVPIQPSPIPVQVQLGSHWMPSHRQPPQRLSKKQQQKERKQRHQQQQQIEGEAMQVDDGDAICPEDLPVPVNSIPISGVVVAKRSGGMAAPPFVLLHPHHTMTYATAGSGAAHEHHI
uniref:Metallo-beta-lactamase domain-containing protein n=1 Tax=Dunaliella tertiolecta TaxID=3047 RepID=A0A7S3QU97_DUNTE|mmetsp:Transcript_18925/g.53021  ORF Transcript_18925/g.53021 Transcript_18925/m.53021 type:complete len:564 (-) Transcript_18925:337-2028(-)